MGTVTAGGRASLAAASVALSLRSRCELFLGPPLLSSHSWPGPAPQVLHRIANVCLSVRPLIFMRFIVPQNAGESCSLLHTASALRGRSLLKFINILGAV